MLKEFWGRVYSEPPKSFADIGCGPGYTLQVAEKLLPQAKIWGIEVQDLPEFVHPGVIKGDFLDVCSDLEPVDFLYCACSMYISWEQQKHFIDECLRLANKAVVFANVYLEDGEGIPDDLHRKVIYSTRDAFAQYIESKGWRKAPGLYDFYTRAAKAVAAPEDELKSAVKIWVENWKPAPLAKILKNNPDYLNQFRAPADATLRRGLILSPKTFFDFYSSKRLPSRDVPFESWTHGSGTHEDHIIDWSNPGDFCIFFKKHISSADILLEVSSVLPNLDEEEEVIVKPLTLQWNEIEYVKVKFALGEGAPQLDISTAVELVKEMKDKNFDLHALDEKWGFEPGENRDEFPSPLTTAAASKVYYHGRRGTSPYHGTYIYITDDPEYALRYSKDKVLLTFTLNFGPDKIFSIKNSQHLSLLRKEIGDRAVDVILRDSGSGEIDWGHLGSIGNDDYETAEDLLSHLGFKALALQERTGIESLLVFDEKNLTQTGEGEFHV